MANLAIRAALAVALALAAPCGSRAAAVPELVVCVVFEPGVVMEAGTESYDCKPPMQCPQLGRPESAFTGFDSDLRKHLFAQPSLQNISYTVNAYASWTELSLRARNNECMGWAPFYQTAARDSCAASECPALPAAWLDSATGKLLHMDNVTAQADASGLDLQAYRCCVDFAGTNAMDWSDGLLYRYESTGGFMVATADLVTRAEFWNLLCVILLVVMIGGHLIWLVERMDRSGDFPKDYTTGIDNGLWWAAVTITTVGYGDKTPRTKFGRAFAFVFMLVGLIALSIFFGYVGQIYEEGQQTTAVLGSIADMPEGSKICTYDAYAKSDWLNGFGYNLIARGGVTQCGELLKKKQVDGIYMDLPILQYYYEHDWDPTDPTVIFTAASTPQLIGIKVPDQTFAGNTPHPLNGVYAAINSEVIRYRERSQVRNAQIDRWFKTPVSDAVANAAEVDTDWWLVAVTVVLYSVYIGIAVVVALREKDTDSDPAKLAISNLGFSAAGFDTQSFELTESDRNGVKGMTDISLAMVYTKLMSLDGKIRLLSPRRNSKRFFEAAHKTARGGAKMAKGEAVQHPADAPVDTPNLEAQDEAARSSSASGLNPLRHRAVVAPINTSV